MTITLGWWLLPLVVTVAVWAWSEWPREVSGSGVYFSFDVEHVFRSIVALIVTLLAWLIYFAMRVWLS